MPQTILGIDLGSYSVKIVQVERGFGEFKIVGFNEVPLVAEEVLTYAQAASAALTKFFEENPINYDSCVMSLPGQMASFRFLDLPFGNAKKIDQTLEFELETLIPMEIENVLFDYSVLSSSPQQSKVLTTYVLEEDFKKFLSHVQVSGVDPRYVGVDTIDLSYLTLLGVLPPEGRFALLDMGHTKTNLVVLEGSKIKTLRCFSWGGHHITQKIAEIAGITYDQAEVMKHTKGQLLEASGDKIFQAIHESFDELMKQIKQTLFAFYETGEHAIEALYLSGGTAKISGVESFFSNQLNINVSSLEVLEDSFTSILDRENAKAIIPTSLGGALRGVYPNKGVRINFRRGDYTYTKDIKQLEGSIKRLGIMAASVAGIGLLYFILSYWTLSSQVDKMNKNLTKMMKSSITEVPKDGFKDDSAALKLLTSKISGMQDKLKRVQGGGGLSALDVLKIISSAMPSREELQVDIDDLNITADRVRIEGRTVSYEGVDKIKAALGQVKNFKNVETGDVRKGLKEEIKFKLSFDIATGT